MRPWVRSPILLKKKERKRERREREKRERKERDRETERYVIMMVK
jgi:hypothetical protein